MSKVMVNSTSVSRIGLIPRAARISVKFPLVFSSSEGRVAGRSLNVSESGALGTFQQPLDVWLSGQLSIGLPSRTILVQTRVVRADGREAAFSFINLDEDDRLALRAVLGSTGMVDDGAASKIDPASY